MSRQASRDPSTSHVEPDVVLGIRLIVELPVSKCQRRNRLTRAHIELTPAGVLAAVQQIRKLVQFYGNREQIFDTRLSEATMQIVYQFAVSAPPTNRGGVGTVEGEIFRVRCSLIERDQQRLSSDLRSFPNSVDPQQRDDRSAIASEDRAPQLSPAFQIHRPILTAGRMTSNNTAMRTLRGMSARKSSRPDNLQAMARGELDISHAAFETVSATRAVGYLRDLLAALDVIPRAAAIISRYDCSRAIAGCVDAA